MLVKSINQSTDQESVEYPLINMTPRFTLTKKGCTNYSLIYEVDRNVLNVLVFTRNADTMYL